MRASKRLVVSAVNLVEGGTLAVLQRFLRSARAELGAEWEIVALVHKVALVQIPGVQALAFPGIKASWLRRIWFEYWQCRKLSQSLRADLWMAMHDITPRVMARRQAVYCHNPSPFYPVSAREALFDWKLLAFQRLYDAMYRINIHRNDAVVVQQQWLREEFRRRYGAKRVVVARPVAPGDQIHATRRFDRGSVFLYPALPRPFKNFELVCRAARPGRAAAGPAVRRGRGLRWTE